MTALLVLLFVTIMVSIDAVRQYRAKHANMSSDIFQHVWGNDVVYTMADGGKKIEKDEKKK
jgi:hypothetical protein